MFDLSVSGSFMVFIYNAKEYACATAVEVVREMERDADGYPHQGGTIRDFLRWSLARLADQIHMRELDTSVHLSDEALAFSYLCLLDEYRLGRLPNIPSHSQSQSR